MRNGVSLNLHSLQKYKLYNLCESSPIHGAYFTNDGNVESSQISTITFGRDNFILYALKLTRTNGKTPQEQWLQILNTMEISNAFMVFRNGDACPISTRSLVYGTTTSDRKATLDYEGHSKEITFDYDGLTDNSTILFISDTRGFGVVSVLEKEIKVKNCTSIEFSNANDLSVYVGQPVYEAILSKQSTDLRNVFKVNYRLLTLSSAGISRGTSQVESGKIDKYNKIFGFLTDSFYFNSISSYQDYVGTIKGKAITLDDSYVYDYDPLSFNVKVIDDTTFTYSIREKGNSDFKIYVGKEIDTDFLTSFEIVATTHNTYLQDRSVVVNNSLDKANLKYNLLKQSDNSIAFQYAYYSINIDFSVNKNLIKIDANKITNNINYLKQDYLIGETFSSSNYPVSNVGGLTYSDDTTIPIEDIFKVDAVATFEMTPSDFVVTQETQSPFTATYIIKSTMFGDYNIPFDINVITETPQAFDHCELIDYKKNFKYGEIIEFGTDSKLQIFNEANLLLKTLSFSEFNNALDYKDPKYSSVVTLTDTPITLTNIYKGHQFTQTINVSYAENLIINVDQVNQNVFVDNNFSGFDFTGIVATINYHNNENGNHSVETINIPFEQLRFEHDPINKNASKIYVIKVSTTYENRILSKSFEINAIVVKPEVLEVTGTDTNVYYDNDNSTFAYPKNVSIKRKWNNGRIDTLNVEADVTYYRDKDYKKPILVGEKISSREGDIVYILDKTYGLKSSYYIVFKQDKIVDAQMINSATIPLGNYLTNFKSKLLIQVTYESGVKNENYLNYSFVNNERIDSEPSEVQINVDDKIYTITGITFSKPNIKSIEIDKSNFHTSFNNTNDYIDCRTLKFNVSYEDSEYTEIVSKYVKDAINSSNEFKVSCTDLPNFAFDGSQKINFSMPSSEVIHNTNLVIELKNHFDMVKSKTTNIPIQIVEITNITGLKLISAKTEYKVGETFLNDSDDTKILVFYKNPNGGENKIEVELKSGFSAINIYPLKGTKFYNQDKNKTIRVSVATNSQIYFEYNIEVLAEYQYNDTTLHNLRVIKQDNYRLPNDVVKRNVYLIVEEKDTEVNQGVRTLKKGLSINNIQVYGFLDDINDKNKNAIVVLFEDYVPVIQGQSNIKVQYPVYVNGNADKINKCHFGQLFGNNNAKNRLFLSGNPSQPNADWHSGAVNTFKQEGDVVEQNGDFTYFEDTSVMSYGQSDNKIVGYDIISDSKMIVLKSKSDKEPTVYYRTNGLINAIDGAGNTQLGINNIALYEESYPLVIGNSKGSGALSNKSIINFNGDTLFLSSDNELDGLDITGQIGDSQRFANTRSYYIDPLLKKTDLSESMLWTDNKYLYIINKNEIFATYFQTLNERQYEWWKFDIKNVSAMVQYGNETYYGSNNGVIGKFHNGLFEDIERMFLPQGSVKLETSEINGDKVIISKDIIQLINCDYKNYFYVENNESDASTYLYYKIAEMNNVKASSGIVDIYINQNKNKLELVGLVNGKVDYERLSKLQQLINETDTYFLNSGSESSEIDASPNNPLKEYYVKYKLKLAESDVNENVCFELWDYNLKTRLNVGGLYRATLVKRIEEPLEIVDVNLKDNSFKLLKNNDKLDLVRYANQPINQTFSARIDTYINVSAYYISAPMTMGDLMYDKTIWGYTLTNDTNIPSEIELCQATNEDDFELISSLEKTDYGFGLDAFNLGSLSYDKVVIPHKTTYYKPILAPFICFAFRNNNGTNCVLSAMQVSYTIAKNSYGGY